MPIKPDEPLKKITLNLYAADVEAAKAYYGQGWSEQIRQIVHQHLQVTQAHYRTRMTLGELEDE